MPKSIKNYRACLWLSVMVSILGGVVVWGGYQIDRKLSEVANIRAVELKSVSDVSFGIQRLKSNLREIIIERGQVKDLQASSGLSDSHTKELEHAMSVVWMSIKNTEEAILVWENAVTLGSAGFLAEEAFHRAPSGRATLDKIKTLKSRLKIINQGAKKLLSHSNTKIDSEINLLFEKEIEPHTRTIQIILRDLEIKTRGAFMEEIKTIRHDVSRALFLVACLTVLTLMSVGVFMWRKKKGGRKIQSDLLPST